MMATGAIVLATIISVQVYPSYLCSDGHLTADHLAHKQKGALILLGSTLPLA
ncbi:hypothetical protein AA0X95_04795 [Bacillus sp. 1P10SD]|uniref:hypothetical protein n=1 Tax=Bacillus sp. 1P10SD TaxID=3132265 RepID=UPI0039A7694D